MKPVAAPEDGALRQGLVRPATTGNFEVRVRFTVNGVCTTSTPWSLDDYAATIEAVLAHNGITRGWLLGESI